MEGMDEVTSTTTSTNDYSSTEENGASSTSANQPEDDGQTFEQRYHAHLLMADWQYSAFKTTMESMEMVRKHLKSETGFGRGQPKNWKKKIFAFLGITQYCHAERSNKLIPAEFGIVIFSFDKGVIAFHSGFFDIGGAIPFSQLGVVQATCGENGFPFPGQYNNGKITLVSPADFMELVIGLAQKYHLYHDQELLFFTTRLNVPRVDSCLSWILEKTGHNNSKFFIVSFEILLKEMSAMDPSKTTGVIKHECGAGRIICSSRYDFNNLGCDWHRSDAASSKVINCNLGIALRRVYNALHYLCNLYRRDLNAFTHVPYAENGRLSPVPTPYQ